MDFVLDNSVVMRWLFNDGSKKDVQYCEKVLSLIIEKGYTPVTPGVWALEVSNVIARAESLGQIEEVRSVHFLEMLSDLDVKTEHLSNDKVFATTLDLARRYKLSSYDASYLELAMRNNIALATLDKDLQTAMKKTGVLLFG